MVRLGMCCADSKVMVAISEPPAAPREGWGVSYMALLAPVNGSTPCRPEKEDGHTK